MNNENTEMVMENYCQECDDVVHSVCNSTDFYDFKVGLIRCPTCGSIIHPCNECLDENGQHYNCGENCSTCPWKNAKVLEPMEEEDYVRWHKGHEPQSYELMKNGELGEYYKDLAKLIENEEKEQNNG